MPSQFDKDKVYLRIAREASKLSKDNKAKIGAVLISNNRIVGVGVNGYPSGYDDNNLEHKHDKVIHAEINALLNYTGDRDKLDIMYIYGLPPCPECMKFIATTGISTVVFKSNDTVRSKQEWLDIHKAVAHIHHRIRFIEYKGELDE